MKSILTHFGNDSGFETRLQAGLDIVRAMQGHLTGVFATPMTNFAGLSPMVGLYVPETVFEAVYQEQEQVRASVEGRLAGEDVPWSSLSNIGPVATSLIGLAAMNDLVVLSRPNQSGDKFVGTSMIADVLTGAPAPVLVMPEGRIGFDVGGAAAIAWNGSFEAANALRAALPMLRRSKSVTLISVEEHSEDRFPQTTASEYLSRHGVASDLVIQPAGSEHVPEALLGAVGRCKADYLVMGAFGHSRAREFWLGGVTRSLLLSAPLPIIFGH